MDVWKIIRSEDGLQKGVDGRRFLAYLNKADTLEDPCVVEKLMAQGQESGDHGDLRKPAEKCKQLVQRKLSFCYIDAG